MFWLSVLWDLKLHVLSHIAAHNESDKDNVCPKKIVHVTFFQVSAVPAAKVADFSGQSGPTSCAFHTNWNLPHGKLQLSYKSVDS